MKPDNSTAKAILALGLALIVAFLYRDGNVTDDTAVALLLAGCLLIITIF